jgi:hypothetical protein
MVSTVATGIILSSINDRWPFGIDERRLDKTTRCRCHKKVASKGQIGDRYGRTIKY